jgi:hypothetical protein
MSYLEICIIIALVALMVGLVLGVFLGARLIRSHYLYMVGMEQRQPVLKPRSQRTHHLRRDEDYY